MSTMVDVIQSEMIVKTVLFCVILAKLVNCAKILGVFMTPSYSHQIIYQPIWKELSLRGHHVTVLTPNPLKDEKLTNLTEVDLSFTYSLVRQEQNKSAVLYKDRTTQSEHARLAKLYEKVTHSILGHSGVQELIKDEDKTFDLLLVEYLYPSMYVFKDIFNCSMIGITSLPLLSVGHEALGNPDNPVVHPSFTLPFSVTTTFNERIMSVLTNLWIRFSTNYRLATILDKIYPQYIKKKIRPINDISQEFSLVIQNSNLAISNSRPLVPNLIEISGIHITKPKPLPEDLKIFLDDSTEGAIYFSLGTNSNSSSLPPQKLTTIIEALADIPYRVLWKFEDQNIIQLPSNIKTRSWLPQQDVLSHSNIKLFISQGGLQSIDEAIFKKKPLLLIPLLADQKYNAHHMKRKGGGLSLDFDTLTKETLKEAIMEMMTNPVYQKNINKLSAIASDQPMPALEKAVWWIEYVLRHNGAEHLKYEGRICLFINTSC
ncbi:hypothetical protein HHI36_016359 [Cryptolaemus montrouzieri]|uniref:UDP-glucuronosyltransferase n=1 Tax=Cryptolaemus montrouzieri TaxID=559131 RepID=A0ABD2NJW4_9CUCU